MKNTRGTLLIIGYTARSLVSMPPTAACRHRQRCRAGVPHRVRRSPDACGGPVWRSCPRRFRRAGRERGPRVTWAGMARSPRRLPRRPADSPALPLQHTQRDSRPLMFRHDYSGAPTKRACLLSSCCCCFAVRTMATRGTRKLTRSVFWAIEDQEERERPRFTTS